MLEVGFTSADLSERTESATSLAVHVFLSFDVRKVEFGGPIWIQRSVKDNQGRKTSSLLVSGKTP